MHRENLLVMGVLFATGALAACNQNDVVDRPAEPAPREDIYVADAAFRTQNWPRDEKGITLPKGATKATRAAQRRALQAMPTDIAKEEDFARRGFIATHPQATIKKFKGNGVSIDLFANDFLLEDFPQTTNPLLWQHSRLMAHSEGLFKVADGVYQVRGFDVANISFLETDNGYVVVDPLTAAEPAKAAYDLVKKYVADKPVKAVIYTHTHSDHFAGISGVVHSDDLGSIEIIAPEGFMEETAKEWMTAGNAMGRRAFYQFGLFLDDGPRARVGVGQGPGIALGTHRLVAPTREITITGETLTIDGLEIIFQLTPGAEAPVEMVFYLPKYKALCMAETVNASIHNVQTLRGAHVRDAKQWADYLTRSLSLFDEAETLFISHHWPRFGRDEIRSYLGKQRDAYKFLHDQTVRMMNQGLTPDEIAENLVLPDSLGSEWYNRGFYGTLSHNSKAVYDKYMGWYNGIPATLNQHIPTERAKRYVAAMGGERAVLELGGTAFDTGDYRWSAEILQHLVFAAPSNKDARELLADSYEQMGYQAESAIWRNIYLSSARELRQGHVDTYTGGQDDYLLEAASNEQLLDLISVRIIPAKARGLDLSVNLIFKENGDVFNLRLENSVLTYHKGVIDDEVGTIRASRKGALAVGLGFLGLRNAKLLRLVTEEGDGAAFGQIGSVVEKPTLDFNIIEP